MPRFVVLEHRWNGVHWDLMLERGEGLRTWALEAPIVEGAEVPARSLPDHRPIYLEYEGPVSAGRGEVRRVAGGTYRVEDWSEGRIGLALDGPQLSGRAMLWTVAGEWRFRFVGKVD